MSEEVAPPKMSYGVNPYLDDLPRADRGIVIKDLRKFNALKSHGRLVLELLFRTRSVNFTSCKVTVTIRELCAIIDPSYNDPTFDRFSEKALPVRIRRGLNNLIADNYLARTNTRNIYWLNKGLVWQI